jgi:hypothetical protein
MEVLQISVSKRRLDSSSSINNNNSSRSTKLRSRSVDNSRRSPSKLRLSSTYNMRISNRRNNNLSSRRRRSAGNLSLSSRCNKYNSLCNRRNPGNLHCRRGTRPGNLSKDEILNCVNEIEQDRPKYKPGAPMLSEANVKAVVPNCAKFHAYVMEHSKDKPTFPAKVDQNYFKGGCGALMLNIEFNSVYNLITMASLDVTFMRLWTL